MSTLLININKRISRFNLSTLCSNSHGFQNIHFRMKISVKREQQEIVLLIDDSEAASATIGRHVRFGRHLYVAGIPRRIMPDNLMNQV